MTAYRVGARLSDGTRSVRVTYTSDQITLAVDEATGVEAPLPPGPWHPTTPGPLTERAVIDLLHHRYSQVRRGTTTRRYAVAAHVPLNGPTSPTDGVWKRERIADFIAQDTHAEPLGRDGRVQRGRREFTPDHPHGRQVDVGERRQVLHGHEIKISRADWLTELRDPTKAQAWARYCDKWWLVAPAHVVKDDLPDGWGHLVVVGDKLRVAVQAPLRDPEPMPVAVQAQLLRATAASAR